MTDTIKPQIEGLRAAIAAAGRAPVILVWIQSRPRIATMRPIAQQLAASGFHVVVAYSPAIAATPEAMGFDSHLRCLQASEDEIRDLTGVAVFISVEIAVENAPKAARRIGIHHSLPDRKLERNHADVLRRDPSGTATMDYYAVLSCQKEEEWTIGNYLPHVDRQFPAALLDGRRDRLAIIPFGYPKIDRMMATDTSGDTLDTITYAPTRSSLKWGSALEAGERILETLLDGFPDHRIAYRPYPGSDVERTRDIYARFLDHPRFSLDDSPTGEQLLRRTALMVSDQSSVAVSFGFGFARPVVFYKANPHEYLRQRGMTPLDPIGLRVSTPDTLKQGVAALLADAPAVKARIEAQRNTFVYNPGRSIEYLIEIMPDIIAGRSRPEWLEIPRRPFRAATPRKYRAQYARLIAAVPPDARGSLKRSEQHLAPAFAYSAGRIFSEAVWRTLRRIPNPRRYLSRPRDRS